MTNYERLFGTPEKAAATLEFFELDTINWCADDGSRKACETCSYDFDPYGCCHDDDDFTLLEWLKQESFEF